MEDIRDVFSAEADNVYVFEVKEKRFEIEKLLKNPEQLFGHGVFSLLPNLAQEDFREC